MNKEENHYKTKPQRAKKGINLTLMIKHRHNSKDAARGTGVR